MSGELLTVKHVQERLKVSERTVFNPMQRGELHGFKVGKSWRFDESDIAEYIERQRKKATSREKSSIEKVTALLLTSEKI